MAFPKKRILPPPPKAKDRHRRMPLVGQTTDIKSAGVQVGVYTCYTYSCIFIYICIINFLYPKLTAPSVLLPFSKHQELSSGEGEAKECYFNKPCANAYMYKRTKDHLPFHILALALKTWFPWMLTPVFYATSIQGPHLKEEVARKKKKLSFYSSPDDGLRCWSLGENCSTSVTYQDERKSQHTGQGSKRPNGAQTKRNKVPGHAKQGEWGGSSSLKQNVLSPPEKGRCPVGISTSQLRRTR